MKRYSIMVRMIGAEFESEHSQCQNNPEPIAAALRAKTTKGRRHLLIYESVRVVDHQEAMA
jgi:hypothetical protein